MKHPLIYFNRVIFVLICSSLVLSFIITNLTKAQESSLPVFYEFYQHIESTNQPPCVPEYDLPLNPNQIINYDQIFGICGIECTDYFCWLSDYFEFYMQVSPPGDTAEVLLDQGFVVAHLSIPFPIVEFYKHLREREIPIFVTSDSLLHIYHVQFDETLMKTEKEYFYPDILMLTEAMLSISKDQYETYTGNLKEAARRNEAFFAVGLRLLDPEDATPISSYVRDEVNTILSLIESHSGFAPDPIFKYKEDYSQYIPRGHYDRSEILKRYFKAMMWYGRISFLLKGGDNPGSTDIDDALITKGDARIQTLQAALIAGTMADLDAPDGRRLFEIWQRIYIVTSFYVGLADDLTPTEYLSALNEAFDGSPIDLLSLSKNEAIFLEFKSQLAQLRSPKIYGGRGREELWTIDTDSQDLDEILDKTMGMRLLGQRFIPDSYIMNQLVFPSVSYLIGDSNKVRFTKVDSILGPVRGFPMGLDVMAAMGSQRANKILEAFGEKDYKGYKDQFKKIEAEFDGFGIEEWNKNLYWSWLYSLKSMLIRPGEGYPTFMQTDAWQDKQLNAALASWAELRHDTILYSKPSYGPAIMCAPPRVVGYVEPVPELYARLLALTQMTNQGLDQMGCLDDTARERLENLEAILERLLQMSLKELRNEVLTNNDYDFIDYFGEFLEGTVLNISNQSLRTEIVADVHVDINSEQVLEEAVGPLDLILVAYKVPDGRIFIGAGPVLSYYEFKYPITERLTDNTWRGLLYSNPPQRPEWVKSFCLDKDNKDRRDTLPYALSLTGNGYENGVDFYSMNVTGLYQNFFLSNYLFGLLYPIFFSRYIYNNYVPYSNYFTPYGLPSYPFFSSSESLHSNTLFLNPFMGYSPFMWCLPLIYPSLYGIYQQNLSDILYVI